MNRMLPYASIAQLVSAMVKKDKQSIVVKNNLAYFMDLYGISAEELASNIGSSTKTINAIISGKHVPSAYLCLLISMYFDISVNSLFYLDVVGGVNDEETI